MLFFKLRRGALCGALVFLVSCAPQNGKRLTETDRLQRDLEDLRAFQAEQTSQISAIQSQLRELVGRVEQLEFGHGQNERLGTDPNSSRQDLSDVRRHVTPPAIVPLTVLEADEALAPSLPREISGILSDSLSYVRQGKFDEALPLLQEGLDRSSASEATPNFIFWIAICYDGLGDSRRALGAYHDFVSRFKKHERAALALLRQGSVFIRLSDKNSARLTFKKLISDYPKSSEAATAKERLKDL